MKATLLAIIISFCSLPSKAQFAFKPDTLQPEVSGLGLPDLDSLQFEFRLWQHNGIAAFFSQLTYNHQGEWNYRTGFFNHNGELKEVQRLSVAPNLDSLWRRIDSLGVLTLASQEVVTATLDSDGKLWKLDYETFDRLLISGHMAFYTVELFSGDGYRTYSYYDPIQITEALKKSEHSWIVTEHEQFAEIIRSVHGTLKFSDSVRLFVEDFSNKYKSKKKKRRVKN